MSEAISTIVSDSVLCINSLYNHAACILGVSDNEIDAMERVDWKWNSDGGIVQKIRITPTLDTIIYEQFEKYYNDAKWMSSDASINKVLQKLNDDIFVCDCGGEWNNEIQRSILLIATDVIIPVGIGKGSYSGALNIAELIKRNTNLNNVWLLFATGFPSNTTIFNLIFKEWQDTIKKINEMLAVPCQSFSTIIPKNCNMGALPPSKRFFHWSKTKNVSAAYISVANELMGDKDI